MTQLFANNAYGSLGATLSNSATSLTLATGQGARFPSPTGGDHFLVTLIGIDSNGNENAWEIVRVTGRSTDALTIVRAQEGTLAAPWVAGTRVEARATSGLFNSLLQKSGGTLTGGVNFIGSGLRITGDFSNATLANRLMFQTSTANGNTGVYLIPHGTAQISTLRLANRSDPANAGYAQIQINNTEVSLVAGFSGTGSYLPLTIAVGGNQQLVIDTTGKGAATRDWTFGGVSVGRGGGSISLNTAIGVDALLNSTINSGENTALGYLACRFNTSGWGQTALGAFALANLTDGDYNTAIGAYALTFNATSLNNCTGIGYEATVTGGNQVQLGNSITTTYVYGTVQNRSDLNDKADVRDTVLGLEFINALRPVDFKWDMREDYRPTRPVAPSESATEEQKAAHDFAMAQWLISCQLENITRDGSKKRLRYHHGLIAQEVKEVLDAMGIDFGGYQDHSVLGGEDVLSIGYDELIAPLIKAVQQLSARVELLEAM